MNLTREFITDIAYCADIDTDGLVHPGYSGRGMFGQSCFGVALAPSQTQEFLVELAIRLTEEGDPEMARELARAARTDNLGYDTILYFPGWQLDTEAAV